MRKFFSILFLIIFIVLFPLALLSFNLKTTILNPTFIKETFRQIDFYKRLVNINPQKVADYISKKQGENQTEISATSVKSILGYLSPEDLQYTLEKNLDSYIKNAAGDNVSIDLTAIKKSVASKNGDPETKEFLLQMPDSYSPVSTNKTANKYFSWSEKIFSYSGAIFAILSLIFSIMLWPSWRGRLRILGIPFLIFGLIIIFGHFFLARISIPTAIVADFWDDIFHDILVAVKTKVLLLYFREGLAMAILGFISIIISCLIKNNLDPKSLQSSNVSTTK